MLYPYLIINRDTNPSLSPTILDWDWESNLAHNINDFSTGFDYSTETWFKTYKNLIVLDEFDRILSKDEIQKELNQDEIYKMKDPLYNNARHLQFLKKQKRRQGRACHKTFRPWAKSMAVYKQDRIMQLTCQEQGVKYNLRFANDTWDGVELIQHSSHKSDHRNTTGWKSKKIRHQWQVHQK